MFKISFKKTLIYILIIILALIIAYFSYTWGKQIFPFSESKYQAVQLISGDIYYGKLRTFPCCKISEAYIIQTNKPQKEGETATTQLVPLSSLFFAPENTMHFSKNQLLWWTNLGNDSQVLKVIREMKNK